VTDDQIEQRVHEFTDRERAAIHTEIDALLHDVPNLRRRAKAYRMIDRRHASAARRVPK
jgi:hypothetical protein